MGSVLTKIYVNPCFWVLMDCTHTLLFFEPNTSAQLARARPGLIIIATPCLFLQWVSFRSAGLCSNSLSIKALGLRAIYGTALFLTVYVLTCAMYLRHTVEQTIGEGGCDLSLLLLFFGSLQPFSCNGPKG
eukprot:3657926-Amphidinium_carterae.1